MDRISFEVRISLQKYARRTAQIYWLVFYSVYGVKIWALLLFVDFTVDFYTTKGRNLIYTFRGADL